MIGKPIDLIVANSMHDIANATEMLTKVLGQVSGPFNFEQEINETIARRLLCDIAHNANMRHVFDALKSVGAPCSHDDIAEGRRAIRERVA